MIYRMRGQPAGKDYFVTWQSPVADFEGAYSGHDDLVEVVVEEVWVQPNSSGWTRFIFDEDPSPKPRPWWKRIGTEPEISGVCE